MNALGSGIASALPGPVNRVLSAVKVRQRLSRAQYRLQAPVYELTSAAGQPLRDAAVAALGPRPGEVVVDVGCGTGLNFPALQKGIGPTGKLLGIEPSPAMLERAAERTAHHGWDNVTLLQAGAQQSDLSPEPADALVLCMVHDVMRDPVALRRSLAMLRPGGRVVAAGSKWADWWALPVNVSTWYLNRLCVTTFEGFDEPWSYLADAVPTLKVAPLDPYFGGAYIAAGTIEEPPSA